MALAQDQTPRSGRRALRVGVMGPANCSAQTAAEAETIGRRVAQAGAVLICGGGRGVMEAASRGASQAGGLVIGILPSENPDWANPYVSVPIVTGLGNARNVINVLTSHALIAVSGGPGTLSEIALAFKVGTPVVGLRSWHCSIEDVPTPGCDIHVAETPEDAVAQAIALAKTRAADECSTEHRLY